MKLAEGVSDMNTSSFPCFWFETAQWPWRDCGLQSWRAVAITGGATEASHGLLASTSNVRQRGACNWVQGRAK